MQQHNEAPRRVAVYCRVSTEKGEQVHSLESQKRYFRDYIARNPGWIPGEVYVDQGITGTSTKKRHAFNRMMADAERHAFDLILTKEISRFARNTLDSIFYTRKLKSLGIGVVFVNDNINTLDADAELRLTIMASIAQEESRKTSDRVKWGQKRRMEQGVVFGRDMLGYDVREGALHINEQGAQTVRLIFHRFVNEGKGAHAIARQLQEDGVPTATRMSAWSHTVILRVLRNEKYCGDLIQKKTYTPSYLNHEKKYNRGEEALVVLRDHHEPIISRALFDAAQAELARRAPSAGRGSRHSDRHCFSGKIQCGLCGRSFVARTKKRRDGSISLSWRCHNAALHGAPRTDSAGNRTGCACPSLSDEDAKWMLQTVVGQMRTVTQAVAARLSGIIDRVVPADASEEVGLTQLRERKRRLIELYLAGAVAEPAFQAMCAKCEAEAAALQAQADARQSPADSRQSRSSPPDDISRVLGRLADGEEWDDAFYRHILDKITIDGDGHAAVTLRFCPTVWRFARVRANGGQTPGSG